MIVTTRSEDGMIDASIETARVEGEIEETARAILAEVWERNEFWAVSA